MKRHPLFKDGSIDNELKNSLQFTPERILEFLPVGFYSCNQSGEIVEYNKKATELWGRTPAKDQKEENFFAGTRHYYENDQLVTPYNNPVALCLSDGQSRQSTAIRIQRPDGSSLLISENIAALKNDDGKVIGAICCFQEVKDKAGININIPGKEGQGNTIEELNENQSYYTQVLKGIQMPVYITDAEGRIVFFNDAAAGLWGCRPDLGKDFWCGSYKLLKPDGTELSPQDHPMRLALNGKKTLSEKEIIVLRPDGTKRIVAPFPQSLYDNAGKLIGAVNLLVDITELRENEQALRVSENKYRDLTALLEKQVEERTRDLQSKNEELKASEERYQKMTAEVEDYAIILLDKDGTILNWNKGAEKIKGYSQTDIIGKNFRIFYTEEDRKTGKPERLIHHAETTGKAVDEGWRKRKDGSLFWGSIVITALHDSKGNVTGFTKVTRDLTERKFAEEELKRSEERYHKMIDEVEDYAIILLDTNGTVLNWNKGAEKIKGFKHDEIVGKNFSTFYTNEDKENGKPQRLINLAFTTGKAADEGWRMRSDGTRFWGSIVITALHNKEGEVIGFSKVTRDLTERKFAEDKLREYSNALEFQNKELEQFAYAASHDMKEPLRKIHLYNSFINENPENHLEPKSKEYLNRSINAVKRMNELIEDLLTYSKSTLNIESFEETDINRLLNEIVQMHKEEVEQKKVKIVLDDFPVMNVVTFQFKQLMDNLVSNAIKYGHPERNVEIRITYEKVPGKVIGDREADPLTMYHKISVIDNGIGFDPQYENKIFEIFQRLSNTGGVKGSGIGLAICKKIAQNHKGFIKAKGRFEEGATFEIYIPVNL
jgi:PAS domain S-box-containing protein